MDNEKDYLGRQYAPSSPDMADLYPAGLYPAGLDEARTDAARSGTAGADGAGPAGADGAGPGGAGSGGASPGGASPSGAGAVPADPASDGAHSEPVPRRQIRVGTVVWGLVLVVLAVLLLLVNTVNLSVDPVLLLLCLALGAGLALLAGGFLAAAARGRKR